MKKPLEDMDIMDNFLMNEVASDIEVGGPACKEMLSILLQRKIGKVRVVPQKNIPPGHPDYRGIIMDVEVEEDIEGTADNNLPDMNIYDFEPHKKPKNKEDLQRRIRFYQAKIDYRRLKSGERNFGKLPNLYIVYVLDYDPFGYGQVCYTIGKTCLEEPKLKYDDGLTIKYFNTTGTKGGNEAINNMLRFIQNSTLQNAVDDATRKMYDYVRIVKGQEETKMHYMTLEEYFEDDIEEAREEARIEGREEGREEGRKEGREEGRKEGREEGRKEGREEGDVIRLLKIICKKLIRGKELEEIAEDLEEEVDDIRPLYDVAAGYAPDYDVEKVFDAYIEHNNAVIN